MNLILVIKIGMSISTIFIATGLLWSIINLIRNPNEKTKMTVIFQSIAFIVCLITLILSYVYIRLNG